MDAVFFLAGSFLFAVSIDTFTAPNQIAAGGLTGVATILNHMFGIPIGLCRNGLPDYHQNGRRHHRLLRND